MRIIKTNDKKCYKNSELDFGQEEINDIRWVPNGSDAMLKDSLVSTMTGGAATDTNQGLYLNSSG